MMMMILRSHFLPFPTSRRANRSSGWKHYPSWNWDHLYKIQQARLIKIATTPIDEEDPSHFNVLVAPSPSFDILLFLLILLAAHLLWDVDTDRLSFGDKDSTWI